MADMRDDAGTSPPSGEAKGGVRRFAIASRHPESDIITSFVLRPEDGKPLAPHKPGQHLTMFPDIPGIGVVKHNYTISAAPNGETYRISVKRERDGLVSRWLHDEAKVGTSFDVAPASGAFVLPEPATRPIVMLSGGVGLTPMIAMLEAIVAGGIDVPVHFVHCTQDGSTHAFRAHLGELAAAVKGKLEITIFYSRPRAEDVVGRDYGIAGRVDMEWLVANTPVGQADYFVCGPLGFLRNFVPGLAKAGVGEERLHFEFFGPVEDLFDEGAGMAQDTAPTAPAASRAVDGSHIARAGAGFSREQIGDGILDSAAEAVIASDRDGQIVLWNSGAERVFGFTEAEALGQSLDIIIPEPFRARHWEGYTETVASGRSRYGAGDLLAVPGLTKDGRRISLEFTIALLKEGGDGAVEGMVAVIRDVTKRFEELKALKKQLAAQQGA
jgi:nitric oxide dioxygenase